MRCCVRSAAEQSVNTAGQEVVRIDEVIVQFALQRALTKTQGKTAAAIQKLVRKENEDIADGKRQEGKALKSFENER